MDVQAVRELIHDTVRGRPPGGLATPPPVAADVVKTVNIIMRAWLFAVPCWVLASAIVPASSMAQSAPTAQQAALGESIYSDYCWTCHGEKLRNPGGGTSFDLRRLRPEDYGRFVNAVFNGKNTMPPWRGVLDSEQVDAIWAYIRATVDR
jgi:mono/diheme cytochrome c family protein